ncbi:MAG: MBL fold metallo-hydrolase, partial [candidate division WOR-3 bacterium]
NAPILYVVNTHYHPDHSWGNWVFAMEGARILAAAETKEDFVRYSPVYFDFYRQRGGDSFEVIKNVRFVPPDSLLSGKTRIDLGGISVEILPFGPAHTAGDVVILVPKDRVVFAGGLLSNGYHPNLGDPKADFNRWLQALDRLELMRVRRYVPGAGLVCKRDAVDKQRRYMKRIIEVCTGAIKNRYPFEDVVKTISIPESEGWLQPNILPFNVQAIYRKEIPRVVDPAFVLDMPEEFLITDGGGNTGSGYIRWSALSREDGYREIEVQWKKSEKREIIAADIKDAISRYHQQGRRALKLEKTSRFEIQAGPAIGASGTWSSLAENSERTSGLWSWTMLWMDGRIYLLQCAAENTDREGTAARNIEILDRIAASIRPKK